MKGRTGSGPSMRPSLMLPISQAAKAIIRLNCIIVSLIMAESYVLR